MESHKAISAVIIPINVFLATSMIVIKTDRLATLGKTILARIEVER